MWVEVAPDDDTDRVSMLAFYPGGDDETPVAKAGGHTADVTIVLDRSSSMESAAADAAAAARVLLTSLPPGVHFNVVGLGSTLDPLWMQPHSSDVSHV